MRSAQHAPPRRQRPRCAGGILPAHAQCGGRCPAPSLHTRWVASWRTFGPSNRALVAEEDVSPMAKCGDACRTSRVGDTQGATEGSAVAVRPACKAHQVAFHHVDPLAVVVERCVHGQTLLGRRKSTKTRLKSVAQTPPERPRQLAAARLGSFDASAVSGCPRQIHRTPSRSTIAWLVAHALSLPVPMVGTATHLPSEPKPHPW